MQFNTPDFSCLSVAETQSFFALPADSDLYALVQHTKQALDEQGGGLPSGLAVMSVLRQLGMDEASCMAALLSDSRMAAAFPEALIAKQYGAAVAGLVKSVRWLHSFNDADSLQVAAPEQAERIRRLLLQASADVRAILIRLAFRAERMRKLEQEPEARQKSVARETLDIYAPLANRLGVGQLKWELEDLSFRFLEPQVYRDIAQNLEERRRDREQYIAAFVLHLQNLLSSAGLEAELSGRPKHIYSIAKKMRSKGLSFAQLYDLRAVRIIVNSLTDCYAVLGVVHGQWPHIASEFDDYIAKPKDNGYQSLHSVVIGPDKKALEVQIRTRAMHEQAESGVAAHWLYKEGGAPTDPHLEGRIGLLRNMLNKGVSDADFVSQFSLEQENTKIYVFTPKGDVIELPRGSTPLDFAYTIHTQVGHRCRGAKVNGRIVPLNTALQDADRLEIITATEADPTREWMNESLGYVHSSQIRAKIRGWFNKLDYQQHVEDGGYIFERELNRYRGRDISDAEYASHFNKTSVKDMLAAIGRGVISNRQLMAAIQRLRKPFTALQEQGRRRTAPQAGAIQVSGVGNLMSHCAACCQPIRGDAIIGYITRGRGVSVHRQNCSNVKKLPAEDLPRLIAVEWGDEAGASAEAELQLQAFDREGLLRDITAVLSKQKVHLNGVRTRSDRAAQTASMLLTLELKNTEQLGVIITQLAQIPNVFEVRRRT